MEPAITNCMTGFKDISWNDEKSRPLSHPVNSTSPVSISRLPSNPQKQETRIRRAVVIRKSVRKMVASGSRKPLRSTPFPGRWLAASDTGRSETIPAWLFDSSVLKIILVPRRFSLLCLLLFPCSFPVPISGRKPFSPVFTSRWTRLTARRAKFPVFFPVKGILPRRRVRTRLPSVAAANSQGVHRRWLECGRIFWCSQPTRTDLFATKRPGHHIRNAVQDYSPIMLVLLAISLTSTVVRFPSCTVTVKSKRPSNVASMWIRYTNHYIASSNFAKEACLTRSKSGAGLIWLGKTTTTLIQEEQGFSVKVSIHISFPAIVPRTLTIFPVYWSGCWYKSQRVVSIGRMLSTGRLKGL